MALKKYEDFRPIEYLYQFYLKKNKENLFVLDFLTEVSLELWTIWKGEKKSLIELGGGPSIFSLIPLSLITQKIDFSDYLNINLDVVRQWLNKKEFFDWDPFFEETLKMELLKSNRMEIVSPWLVEHRKEIIRRRIQKIFILDLKTTQLYLDEYDIVSCHFVPECITSNREEFLYVFQNIISCIKNGGYLIISFFLEGKFLRVGRSVYSTFNINKNWIIKIFSHYNLEIIKIKTLPTIFHYGYKEILCILARYNSGKVHSYPDWIIESQNFHFFIKALELYSKKIKKIFISGMLNRNYILLLSGLLKKKSVIFHSFCKEIYDQMYFFLKGKTYEFMIQNQWLIFEEDFFQKHKVFLEYTPIKPIQKYNVKQILKNKSFYLHQMIYNKKISYLSFFHGFLIWNRCHLQNSQLQNMFERKNQFLKSIFPVNSEQIALHLRDFHSLTELETFLEIIQNSPVKTLEKCEQNFFCYRIDQTLKIQLTSKTRTILENSSYILDIDFQRHKRQKQLPFFFNYYVIHF